MPHCAVGHATHPQWDGALALVAAQLEGAPIEPTLGLAYFTDAYAADAEALSAALRARWPAVSWAGCVGVGVAASGVEYFDEPGLVVMLVDLPREQFRVFSGAAPLPPAETFQAFSALVHADPGTPDVDELIQEMSERTTSGYLFGGLASSRGALVHLADGPCRGGLSGVAFSEQVALVSRVTQGCQPIGPQRTVTAAERNIVLELDGKSALPLLLADLKIDNLEDRKQVIPRLRGTLVGLSGADEALLARGGQFGADTRVRHLMGLDPSRAAVAVADIVEPGMRLAFCARHVDAARRDLVRICSEIRDEAESAEPPRRIAGALYVSCNGRGGEHFGGPSAELQIVQHALGDVPLAGFFAAGEIARHHLYGYTGVLTVFTDAAG